MTKCVLLVYTIHVFNHFDCALAGANYEKVLDLGVGNDGTLLRVLLCLFLVRLSIPKRLLLSEKSKAHTASKGALSSSSSKRKPTFL